MDAKIVFSDVDGTLLSSAHRVLEGSLYAIHNLQERGIPFVIILRQGMNSRLYS